MKSLFTVHRASKRRSESLPLHSHNEGQLTFAATGMVQIHTEAGVWLVPPQLAAWVPAGMVHRLEVLTDAELWMVHWKPAALRAWGSHASLDRAFVLRVTPLLRALLTEAVAAGAMTNAITNATSDALSDALSDATLDATPDKAELVVRLMLYELKVMQDAPTFLPLPTSSVGQRVAQLALADHRNLLGLAELAWRAATSVRTVTRLFPKETGLTLKAWRQRARIVRAMEQLSRGDASSKVARETGYASTAAFSCAFRQVTALTPTAFMERAA